MMATDYVPPNTSSPMKDFH